MTVGELLDQLKGVDPNRLVVMAKDAEGNDYSPCNSLWVGAYRAETTWSGEVGFESTDESLKQGYTEEDVISDGQPAVILCPVN